jgi:hypothetical protein
LYWFTCLDLSNGFDRRRVYWRFAWFQSCPFVTFDQTYLIAEALWSLLNFLWSSFRWGNIEVNLIEFRRSVKIFHLNATFSWKLSPFWSIFQEIRKNFIFLSKCNLFCLFLGFLFDWYRLHVYLHLTSLDIMLGFRFFYLSRKSLCLFLHFVGLIGDVIIVYDNCCKFRVNGKMRCSHLIMQILLIIFHLH